MISEDEDITFVYASGSGLLPSFFEFLTPPKRWETAREIYLQHGYTSLPVATDPVPLVPGPCFFRNLILWGTGQADISDEGVVLLKVQQQEMKGPTGPYIMGPLQFRITGQATVTASRPCEVLYRFDMGWLQVVVGPGEEG